MIIQPGELIYENALSSSEDTADFQLEGEAIIEYPEGRMRMRNALDPSLGQKSNFVYWCPDDFAADAVISWDFWPLADVGLCILFFCAAGHDGEDLFHPMLAPRNGHYSQYHHGGINAFHVSYYRRRIPETRAFKVCNLRKSYGFHMVAQGADPIPSIADADPPYRIQVAKLGPAVEFSINELPVLRFDDDGETYGPLIGGGKVGFRQMAPMVAEYANLRVYRAKEG